MFKQGELRERTIQHQLQRASALNIIINAISIWNTLHLTTAVEYKKRNNCKIFSVCHKPLSYADKNFVYATPNDFVNLIKHACCVISNSFHGTCFAMIYNIPYRIVNRPDGLNVRMQDLLERKCP